MCKKTKGLHNRIDPCMRDYLDFVSITLNQIPRASCCGHGKYQKSVIIEKTNVLGEVKYFELISGIEIPRKRKFYKRDKNNFYYIPEVVNGNNKTR